jgi:hypothetical protein
VEVSLEASYAYTWNGSDENTETITWSAPVTVGPRERGHVFVTASRSKIEVPYSLKGEVVFKSGKRFSRTLSGIYTGENAHNVKVTMSFEKLDPMPTAMERRRTEIIPATVTFRQGP